MAAHRQLRPSNAHHEAASRQRRPALMHIRMLTRRVDRDDWLAGLAHTWIERLALHTHIDQVDVICLEQGRIDLPSNVRVSSMGKERGANRLTEFLNFHRAIAPTIRSVDVIFGHMIPRYTLV